MVAINFNVVQRSKPFVYEKQDKRQNLRLHKKLQETQTTTATAAANMRLNQHLFSSFSMCLVAILSSNWGIVL
jgi:hypothetical protein